MFPETQLCIDMCPSLTYKIIKTRWRQRVQAACSINSEWKVQFLSSSGCILTRRQRQKALSNIYIHAVTDWSLNLLTPWQHIETYLWFSIDILIWKSILEKKKGSYHWWLIEHKYYGSMTKTEAVHLTHRRSLTCDILLWKFSQTHRCCRKSHKKRCVHYWYFLNLLNMKISLLFPSDFHTFRTEMVLSFHTWHCKGSHVPFFQNWTSTGVVFTYLVPPNMNILSSTMTQHCLLLLVGTMPDVSTLDHSNVERSSLCRSLKCWFSTRLKPPNTYRLPLWITVKQRKEKVNKINTG